jgi:hypothetical protein
MRTLFLSLSLPSFHQEQGQRKPLPSPSCLSSSSCPSTRVLSSSPARSFPSFSRGRGRRQPTPYPSRPSFPSRPSTCALSFFFSLARSILPSGTRMTATAIPSLSFLSVFSFLSVHARTLFLSLSLVYFLSFIHHDGKNDKNCADGAKKPGNGRRRRRCHWSRSRQKPFICPKCIFPLNSSLRSSARVVVRGSCFW